MALIKCPECGKEVSDTCDQCIHCGFKFNKNSGYESKNEKYIPRKVVPRQMNNKRNVMSMKYAKMCLICGPLSTVCGLIFLIMILSVFKNYDFSFIFCLLFGILCVVIGIISTIKGINAYKYHKNNF